MSRSPLLAAPALLAALAATASHAQPAARPGHYVVEPSHTQILFGVNHLGFTTYYGWFSGAAGTSGSAWPWMAMPAREAGSAGPREAPR